MPDRIVPMIHVPDVRAAAEWYESIGFTLNDTYGDDGGGLSFAILSFGSSQVMFNQGGQPSTRHRREVDLYIYATGIDALFATLKDRVEVVEEPHDTFYGMREFIIRDLNRFWLTFGQPSPFGALMHAVREDNAELVRTTLAGTQMTPETLTAALECADGETNPQIVELLVGAGATRPVEVNPEVLESYVGIYQHKDGPRLRIELKDGRLMAALGEQEPLRLMAIDQTSFRPIDFDNYGILRFNSEGDQVTGCVLDHGGHTVQLVRMS